jgi:AraC-like DNA-binding protein
VSFCELSLPSADGVIRVGGGGAPTTIVSGFFTLDPLSGRFADLLPPFILIRADQALGHAVVTTLQMLSAELISPAPGSPIIATRLADILFIQAMRAYGAAGGCGEKPPWLRALADPQIGKSLDAMHRAIEKPWTLAALAREAGMSRSAFAARFKTVLGETPLEYLRRWRMETAGRLLRDRKTKLYGVAKAVGYQGHASFTRAFQRVFGVTPESWRNQHVNRARHIVRDEEPARGIDYHVDRAAPVAVGVGPASD